MLEAYPFKLLRILEESQLLFVRFILDILCINIILTVFIIIYLVSNNNNKNGKNNLNYRSHYDYDRHCS
jgi:hypothetical protein